MPTLSEYWEAERVLHADRVKALVSEAQGLSAELQQLTATELPDTVSEFARTAEDIAKLRKALAHASLPADAAALVTGIQSRLIEQRDSERRMVELRRNIGARRARVEVQHKALTRARAALAHAEHCLVLAKRAELVREEAFSALAVAPRSNVAADAAVVRDGAVGLAAAARINVLPPQLLVLAEQQLACELAAEQSARELVWSAETALAVHAASKGGSEGELAYARQRFERSEARLLHYAATCLYDLNRARQLLTRVGQEPVLSAAESTAAAEHASGASAASAAADLVSAKAALHAAAAAYDQAMLMARVANPDGDVQSEPSVVTARSAFEDAQRELASRKASFSEREALRGLSVVLPDAAWTRVRDYLVARALLADLTASPATLVSDVAAREADYVTALQAAASQRRVRELMEDALLERNRQNEALAALRSDRLRSSLRGDDL